MRWYFDASHKGFMDYVMGFGIMLLEQLLIDYLSFIIMDVGIL
jgi:hypothetical protein